MSLKQIILDRWNGTDSITERETILEEIQEAFAELIRVAAGRAPEYRRAYMDMLKYLCELLTHYGASLPELGDHRLIPLDSPKVLQIAFRLATTRVLQRDGEYRALQEMKGGVWHETRLLDLEEMFQYKAGTKSSELEHAQKVLRDLKVPYSETSFPLAVPCYICKAPIGERCRQTGEK